MYVSSLLHDRCKQGEKKLADLRKYNDPTEAFAKLTLLLTIGIDRQLRALSAQLGVGVGPLIREWIVKELQGSRGPAVVANGVEIDLSGGGRH